jgi:hypothetical protein
MRHAGTANAGGGDSLAETLSAKGLRLDTGQTVWLAPETGPLATRPLLFLASRADELQDVYYARVRAASSGAVLDLWWLTNITRTSSAAERSLKRVGRYVAYSVQLGDSYDAVVILDTSGEPEKLTAGWPASLRWRNAITNLQECGRLQGFGRKRYQFASPVDRLDIIQEKGRFVLMADGKRVVIDPETDAVEGESDLVRPQPMVKSQPGAITWLVDTVRNVSWIGPEAIEWLEHTVFGVTDRAERIYYALFGADTAAAVEKELGISRQRSREPEPLPEDEIDLGWPPPDLKPQLEEVVKGEGEWMLVADPDFVNAYPNAPHAFYQTFIRVDPERPYARVYVTLWDPRQVQLHIAMGTVEPESATGKTGTGMIPREKELLGRLVGAFNGGFQALHGEFGMMANGEVYLPPKPWAATVAVFDDGRVGMGSWRGPGRREWDEEAANRQIPRDMVSMRQNLTSVVEDGVYNPWKRWWWGAAPEAAEEQTYIYRSGICLTEGRFLAFFWGDSMGPEELGKAMLATRCVRGIHLDMNSKHTGFEFYRTYPPGGPRPEPLDRELDEKAEGEGEISDSGGFMFRARKAVTAMKQLRFPRYVGRDPRDFFYLTLKPILPGPDLVSGGKKTRFRTAGLPEAGWPRAFARTEIAEPDGTLVRLVRIDPSRAVPEPLADRSHVRALGYLSRPPSTRGAEKRPGPHQSPLLTTAEVNVTPGNKALLAVRKRLGWRFSVGEPKRSATPLLQGPLLSETPGAGAAVGADSNGFLVYGECEAANGNLLSARLRDAGVDRAIALSPGNRLVFVDGLHYTSVDGKSEITVDPRSDLAFLAEERPAADIMFPETEPRPYRFWGWLQGRRVRYFPTGPPRFPLPDHLK